MRRVSLILLIIVLLLPSIGVSEGSDPNSEIINLGGLARNAIPKGKPGRLRAYLLPVGQNGEQSIKDLNEALRTEKGRSGYFALLSNDQAGLVATVLEVLHNIAHNCFNKLTIIYVGYKQYEDIIYNAFLHTGAAFIFKEMDK